MSKVTSIRCIVTNISWTVARPQLREFFSRFARVKDCNVLFNVNTGVSKGIGFVTFENQDGFNKMMKEAKEGEEGLFLEGRMMEVRPLRAAEER